MGGHWSSQQGKTKSRLKKMRMGSIAAAKTAVNPKDKMAMSYWEIRKEEKTMDWQGGRANWKESGRKGDNGMGIVERRESLTIKMTEKADLKRKKASKKEVCLPFACHWGNYKWNEVWLKMKWKASFLRNLLFVNCTENNEWTVEIKKTQRLVWSDAELRITEL